MGHQNRERVATGSYAQGAASVPAASAGGDYIAIKSATDALDKKPIDIEDNLIQRKLTGQGHRPLPTKADQQTQLLSKRHSRRRLPAHNAAPRSSRNVQAQLSSNRARLHQLITDELDAFNKLLRDRGILNVILRTGQ